MSQSRMLLAGDAAEDRPTALAETLRELVPAGQSARIDVGYDDGPVINADLTDVTVHTKDDHGALHSSQAGASTFEPAEREPDVARAITVQAHPLYVDALPVQLDFDARNVPIEWQRDARGAWAVEATPTPDRPLVGAARVSVQQSALLEFANATLERELRGQGFAVTLQDASFATLQPNSVRGTVQAKVKKGILSASAEATATLTVDANMVARVTELRLTSRNPIVQGLLGAAQGKVERAVSKPIALHEHLPEGIRVTEVRFETGTDLTAALMLG